MAACTKIPVALPGDGPIPKITIKEIICTFFPNAWGDVSPETLIVEANGGANQNYTIERPYTEGQTSAEPRKIFLKLHSQHDPILDVFRDLVPSKHEEAQLCRGYGQSGLGAKVYGFFQTNDGTLGRVDEFLDARNLKPEDVEDAVIRADVARGYAAFHAMKTPLKESPVQVYYDVITKQLQKFHKMDKLKKLFRERGFDLDELVNYDFAAKITRITERLDVMGAKEAWCIHDVSFVNMMVKSNPKHGESRIALIDFEFVFRNYRAFDIGGHFMQKVLNWVDEDDNARPYTTKEKMHFCKEYAEQWNQETGDSDTWEQVLKESELGYLLAITFDIHSMLCYVERDDSKGLLSQLNLSSFQQLFKYFVNEYQRLGLDI